MVKGLPEVTLFNCDYPSLMRDYFFDFEVRFERI